VNGPAIAGRLISIAHAIVANDACDSQPVVGKNLTSTSMLSLSMLGNLAPGVYGRLIPPER
jgi:hypothetical protein